MRRDSDPPASLFSKPPVRLFLITVVMALAITTGWAVTRATGVVMKTKPTLARSVGNPIPVVAAAVVRDRVKDVVGATTLAVASQSVAVNVAVSEAQVRAVHAELGQLVQPGAALVEFDNSVFREARARARQQRTMARSEIQRIEAESASRRRELSATIAAARERVAYWTSTLELTAKMHERMQALFEERVAPLTDVEQARAKWDAAKSELAQARLELVKVENELANEPVVARAQLDAARYKVDVAEQELALAEKNIENTTVRAPHRGVIGKRMVDVGEWVKSGKTLFALDLITPIYAVADIEQEKLPYVSMAEPAEVTFDTYPTSPFNGKVVKIDPSVDPARRTFKAFVLLPNADSTLRPGMAGFTRMSRSRDATLVPRVAVINPTGSLAESASVFVVHDDGVTLRKVKLGRPEGVGRIEVVSGLEPGELVVIHGQKDLNVGDRVIATIVDPTAEPAASGRAPKRSPVAPSAPRTPTPNAASWTSEAFAAVAPEPVARTRPGRQQTPRPAPAAEPSAPNIRPTASLPERGRPTVRPETAPKPAAAVSSTPSTRSSNPSLEPPRTPRPQVARAADGDDMNAVIDWVLKGRGVGGRNPLD
jgi:membrane fusion protein (multidrug efflux system)